MEPQKNPILDQEQPVQNTNVMVDLLHPQEFAPEPAPVAPVVAPAAAAVVPAPPVLPAAPIPAAVSAPAAPASSVNQIGTTQQPRLKKAFPAKMIIIVVAVLLILAGLGAGGYFYFGKSTTPKPVAKVNISAGPVSQLAQSSGSALLAPGAVTNQATLNLTFDFATSANAGSVIPEVEVQPIGTAFTDEATTAGTAVVATGRSLHLVVPAAGIKDGSYHWQGRVKVGDNAGAWSQFSADTVSFIVDTVVPGAPVLSTVGGVKMSGTGVKTTSQRPLFAGTSDPNTNITLAVTPEGLSYSATSAADGTWSVTPTDDLPNGDHAVTISAIDAAGNSSRSEITVSVNPVPTAVATAPAAAPTSAPNLAPTGDPVIPVSLFAILILALSALGLYGIARRHEG